MTELYTLNPEQLRKLFLLWEQDVAMGLCEPHSDDTSTEARASASAEGFTHYYNQVKETQ